MIALLLIFISSLVNAYSPLDLLSSNQQAGVSEYKNAIGVNVTGNHNSGIVTYYDSLLSQNPCITKLATAFYAEINKNDVEAKRNVRRLDRPPDAPSFSIDDPVFDQSNNKGKFWDLALKYAGGNKNLAMSLVGICGHDDDVQSNVIACPSKYSNIYFSESLGAGVNISSALRRKVIDSQGDNGIGLYIPNKYYHVIGAASTSCLLLRRGVPKPIAKTMVVTAVNAYRSGRLCEKFKNPGFGNFRMSHRESLASALSEGPNSSAWESMVGNIGGLLRKPINIKQKKLEIALSHLDAQAFFINNKIIMNECRQARVSGKLISFLISLNKNSITCESSMGSDRCLRLRHRVQTWSVDREWTEAQHLAGLDFASQNCPNDIESGTELEQKACKLASPNNIDPGVKTDDLTDTVN